MVRPRAVARVLLLGAGLGTAACVSLEQSAPPVAAVNAAAPGANLALGREIYITSCAKCHAVEPVRKYSREDWKNHIIPEMAALTKLIRTRPGPSTIMSWPYFDTPVQ